MHRTLAALLLAALLAASAASAMNGPEDRQTGSSRATAISEQRDVQLGPKYVTIAQAASLHKRPSRNQAVWKQKTSH
jgi:ferric-dicitrate binding protein FerR (iron transport regulator)